ncbi:N-methylhydantoinase B/oxoprolinase/acetone carboxylase alpha subunit [Bradyrhizobium sp. GM5.1]
MARSAVAYAARIMSGRDMNQNAGALRPLTIITRPGSILEPGWNASVAAGNHETSMRIVDAIFRAMQDTIPERLSAGGATTAGVLFFAEPRQNGSWKMLYEVHGGGEGARHDRDGISATRVHLSNTSNTPVEVIEANYAIQIEQQAIRWQSGGAGAHRGGDGVIRSYRILAPSMHLTTCIERMVMAPFGMQGGKPGKACRISLIRQGANVAIDGKSNLVLQQGDLVTIETCGGGGYGAEAAE